jgi:hypothetical protein
MYKQEKFIFSPTKNYIFSKKEKIIDPKPKYTFHKLSPTQKNYNTFRPVKPFNRFGKSKIYNTGIDPPTIYVDFIKKDPDKPYKRNISPLIANDAKYVPTSPLKWGIGCTKSCNNEYLLPKYDPYKEYNFIKKIKINTKINNQNEKDEKEQKFEKTYLPTDHISIREPKISRSTKKGNNDSILFPYLKLKGEFNNTSDSNSFWVPRNNANMSISNKSSVDYNIINNTQNNVSTMRTDMLFNKNLHNKKKGIEEFINTQRPFGPNYNQTFSKLLKENRNRFRNYRGIFTELYDSATKNGNIYKPFHERDEDEFKNKNNKKLNLHKF